MRSAALYIVAGLVLMAAQFGCTTPEEIAPERNDPILPYYMPRTTESEYVYKYYGFYSGKGDSLFTVDYLGIVSDNMLQPIDGRTPIHRYTINSVPEKTPHETHLYVSDSLIVEYGADCSKTAERFVPLKGRLKIGQMWAAAQAFQAGKDYQISYVARVESHFDKIVVADSIVYNDVWQVSYEVTGTPPASSNLPAEYLPKAHRAIYFARGIGRVLEVAFSPDNKIQWEAELLKVQPR